MNFLKDNKFYSLYLLIFVSGVLATLLWLKNYDHVLGILISLGAFVLLEVILKIWLNKDKVQTLLEAKKMGGDFPHLSIFDDFNLGVLCVNNDGIILNTNIEFCNKTGYQESDLIGKNVKKIFGQVEAEVQERIDNRINGKQEIYETSLLHKDGKTGRYYIAGMPLVDSLKQPKGSIGVILDVTDLRENQMQLEKIRNKLEVSLKKEKELNILKSQFIATASHQFKTPMTTIQNSAELIYAIGSKVELQTKNKLIKSTERIFDGVSQMTDLMENILLLSSADSKKQAANFEIIDLIPLTIEIVDRFNFIQKDKRQAELEIDKKSLLIRVDEKLLDNALSNLISNAFKYSTESPPPKVSITLEDQWVKIIVEDYGIGIPESDLKNLGSRFFRGGNTNNYKGTGLGLSIAKTYVELMNGSLEIQSEENKGTKIKVLLPIIEGV